MTSTRPTKISRVSAGMRPSASHYNQLVDAINALSDKVGGPPLGSSPALRMVSLDEDVVAYDRDAVSNHILYDPTVTAGTDPVKDWGSDEDYTSELQGGVHLEGERLALFWDKSAGKQLILPFTCWHMAKLTSALTCEGSATAKIWQMGVSAEEASSVADQTVYDWILGDDSTAKLPSGTKVFVFLHRQSRRWYVVGIVPPKLFGRAKYGSALTVNNATIDGTLENQWGYGQDHTDTSITLHNMETGTDGLYEFSGTSGDACLVDYMGYDNHWQIVQPQC